MIVHEGLELIHIRATSLQGRKIDFGGDLYEEVMLMLQTLANYGYVVVDAPVYSPTREEWTDLRYTYKGTLYDEDGEEAEWDE